MERPEALERDQQVTEQISGVPAAVELHSTQESFHLLCVKRILVVSLFIFKSIFELLRFNPKCYCIQQPLKKLQLSYDYYSKNAPSIALNNFLQRR